MYRHTENPQGDYVNRAGQRYLLEWCRRVRPSNGWTQFDSLEECLATWELTFSPLIEP